MADLRLAPPLHVLKLFAKQDQNHQRVSSLLLGLSEILPGWLLPHSRLISGLSFTLLNYSLAGRTLEEEYTYTAHFNRSDFFKGHILAPLRRLAFVLIRLAEITGTALVLGPVQKVHYRRLMTLLLLSVGAYSVAHLVAGVREMTLLKQEQADSFGLKLIALLYLLQYCIVAAKWIIKLFSSARQPPGQRPGEDRARPGEERRNKKGLQCVICMDQLSSASMTKCGHVFCWECVTRHVSEKGDCPSCRAECEPGAIVLLRNYG